MHSAASDVLGLTLASVLLIASPLHAQLKTKVTVDPSQGKAVLYTTSLGAAADRWDTNAYDAATIQALQDAGITNLRVPGNNGIDSLYHWSNGTVTNPYTDDRAPAFPREKMFAAVVPVIDQLGTAIVSVNYGTNLEGSGGGEPAEAAAWVAYANGSPSSTQAIGKDSTGNDWKTVGFWATLRASKPLPTDDGYNHLRIGHPDPLGIMLWTIGNEPWNNGFYNQSRTVGSDADNSGKYDQSPSPEADLHAGKVPNSKEWGRHQGNAKVGPTAYGEAVVQYAKAMKAVDPKILVGAFVIQPPYVSGADQLGKNWNAGVLKAACASMDFSAAAFWEGNTQPATTDTMDEEDLVTLARDPMDPTRYFPGGNRLHYDFGQLVHDLVEKYKKFCPSNHQPPLAITSLGIAQWLPYKNPAAAALFSADAVTMLLENGAYTVVWSPIHAPSPSFLDEKNQPQPAYYGIKLIHQVALPGDAFVNATSQMDSLKVHAVKRRDGGLGLLLINDDLARSTAVTVSVNGYAYATKGTRYDYGKLTIDAGKTITEAPIENLGPTFTVEVPRYGITAIVIPKAQ
jgi:alpha-L-arabinofuranosidase